MKALLITREDIVKKTVMNGNVDTDQFIQHIEIAQDIHIQNYLGTDLLVKIQSLISAGTIGDAGNEDYNTLLVKYVKPMLIHWAMTEYLPFAAFTASNGGIYKRTVENGENASREDLSFLIEKERNLAEYYTRRFVDYMSFNQESFPEYYTNSNDDIHPDTNATFNGWVL